MRRFILSIAILLTATLARGQEISCGTELTPSHMEYLMKKVEYAKRTGQIRAGSVKIPVQVHIVKNEDGVASASMDDIVTEFDKLNDLFSGADMEFYLSSKIDVIEEPAFYDFHQDEEAKLAASRDVPNAINIYFVGTITNKQGYEICGYTYYPESNRDRIFVAGGCLRNSSTLAHEIGHYFSLIHTHGISGIDPEAVNGENCDETGDLICDTPADPNLMGKVNARCEYTGHDNDFNGDAYSPDPLNIMSYAPSYCRSEFSPGQYEVMLATYREDKNYLVPDENFAPIADIISSIDLNKKTDNNLKVNVYSNPGIDRFGVEIVNGAEGEYHIQVFNMMGNMLVEKALDTYNEGSKTIVDLNGYSRGIFFVNITGQGSHASQKVVLM